MKLVPFESHCLDEVAGGSIDVVSFKFHHELPLQGFDSVHNFTLFRVSGAFCPGSAFHQGSCESTSLA